MSCIEIHVLREYLDGELELKRIVEIEDHLQNCRDCRQKLNTIIDNDRWVNFVLSKYLEQFTMDNPGCEAAWTRLSTKTGNFKQRRLWRLGIKWRKLAAAAAAVLVLGSLSFGNVREAVADFLTVFRVEKVETISITPQEIAQIEQAIQQGIDNIDIENFGEIKVNGSHDSVLCKNLGEAREKVNFPIKLPRVEGYDEPQIRIERAPRLSLMLDVDQVNSLIKNLNGSKFLPAELDGKTATVVIPDRVDMDFYSPQGLPSFSFAQMRSPELLVPGDVNVEAVRDALLGLPFWPDRIRNQLAAINDWQHTFVFPDTGATKVTVRGHEGIFSTTSDSSYGALIWSEDGVIYSLSGTFTREKALEIVESLR